LTTESLDSVDSTNDWFVPRPFRGGSRPRERPGARDRISVPLWNPCSHVKERGGRACAPFTHPRRRADGRRPGGGVLERPRRRGKKKTVSDSWGGVR